MALGRGNACAAGVMLAASFTHLLGEAVQELADDAEPAAGTPGDTEEGELEPYPIACLLAGVGYVATLLCEEAALAASGSSSPCCTAESPLRGPPTGQPPGGKHSTFVGAALVGVALSFHSVLEGMALGAQRSTGGIFDTFLAIAAHKGLAAFALGSTVIDSGASHARFWAVVGPFAAATPVGIIIGLAITASGEGHWSAYISALAAGTFLFVAVNEILPKELANPVGKAAKLGYFVLGFASMALLAVWA